MYLYSNKPAPLASPAVLIGLDEHSQILALNARDGSVRWTQSLMGVQISITGGPGKLFYVASQTKISARKTSPKRVFLISNGLVSQDMRHKTAS
jgi:hypothetical protein